MAAVDRSKQILTIYKGTEKVIAGAVGVKALAITGLTAGAVVPVGEYKVSWTEGTQESAKVDVPTFTVTAA